MAIFNILVNTGIDPDPRDYRADIADLTVDNTTDNISNLTV